MVRRDRPDRDPNRLLVAGLTAALDATAREVAGAFSRAGIECILLKGPTVARWLYEDELDRGYVDVDLLVRSGDAASAGAVLASRGFERSFLELALPFGRRPHAVTWTRSLPGPVEIDLHDTLPGAAISPQHVWSTLAVETETMHVGGADLKVLREPGRALLIALHAGHHGVAAQQAAADLERALILVGESTWREAGALAQRLDAIPTFASGLRLLPAGERVAAELGLPVSTSVESILHASSAPELALSFNWLMRAPNYRVRARLVLRKLAPPVVVMRARSPLARRGRRGLAAAYAVQSLWVVWRGIPALRAWRKARRRNRRGLG